MDQVLEMPVRFRLDALLSERQPPIGQSELARESGVSFATINGIANNRTGQVSLETLDKLSSALSKLLKRRIEPGDLVERAREKRPRRE